MVKSYAAGEGQQQQQPRANRAPPVVKYPFPVSSWILLKMTLFFFTKNASATKKTRMKIKKFLGILDSTDYQNNEELLSKLALAMTVSKAYYEKGADTVSAAEQYLTDDTDWWDYHANFIQCYRQESGHAVDGEVLGNELSDEDVQQVDDFVSTKLQFYYLWGSAQWMREVADRIQSDTLGNITEFTEDFLGRMEAVVHAARQAKSISGFERNDFLTGEDSFHDAVRRAHEDRNRPQSMVRTGVGFMNEMLAGGYQGSRIYVHFGRSGDWKSGILLNAALWCCDQGINPTFVTRDPTRTPCVLYITQENDAMESVERIISHRMGSHVELKGYEDPERLAELIDQSFSGSNCKFSFKYRPSRSITTADIDAFIYEEWTQKREVIMVVHDYIKRIKAVEKFDGARHLELGAVVDEELSIAKKYGIPFVTAMQLTRDAYDKFSNAAQKGSMEAMLSMGPQHVGESLMVYENADCVIFQSREFPQSVDDVFLVQRRVKMRGKKGSSIEHFAQPFARNEDGTVNEMRLQEDANLPKGQWAGKPDLRNGIVSAYDPNGEAINATQPTRNPGGHAAPSAAPAGGGAPRRTGAPPPRRRGTPGQEARDATPGVVPTASEAAQPRTSGLDDLERV